MPARTSLTLHPPSPPTVRKYSVYLPCLCFMAVWLCDGIPFFLLQALGLELRFYTYAMLALHACMAL